MAKSILSHESVEGEGSGGNRNDAFKLTYMLVFVILGQTNLE